MTKRPKKPVCSDVFRYICENLDENLDSPECREIRKHIKDCPDCVAYLDSLKKTVKLYRICPDPVLPARVRRQLYATLDLPAPARKKRTSRKTGTGR